MSSIKEQQELARLQREADWKAVLGSPQGQRVMGYLMQASGYHASSYGGPDTHYTAFCEGRRSVGQFIVSQVRVAAPEQLSTIIMGGLHESGRYDSNTNNGNSDGSDNEHGTIYGD